MRKNLWKILLSIFAIFGTVAALLSGILVSANAIRRSESATNVTQLGRQSAVAGGVVDVASPYVPSEPTILTPGQTPSSIYYLPTIRDNAPGILDLANSTINPVGNFYARYQTNLSNFKLLGIDGFGADYVDAFKNISAAQYNTSPEQVSAGVAATKLFTDPIIANEKFNALNGFGSALPFTQDLTIIQPSRIVDTFSSEFTPKTSAADAQLVREALLSNQSFAYEVAKINLNELQTYQSLAFKYQDNSQADVAAHKYLIVISNENGDIKKFVDGVTTNGGVGSIQTLVRNQNIFIRDTERSAAVAIAPDPSNTVINRPALLRDRVSLVYSRDAQTSINYLSIMIAPSDNNVAANSGIVFGVESTQSDANALKPDVLSYGLLDTTISPRHTLQMTQIASVYPNLQNPVDFDAATPNEPLIPAPATNADFVSTVLPIYATAGSWRKETAFFSSAKLDANLIRLFMMQGESLVQTMQFAGSSNNFADGLNTLTINYTAKSTITIDPSSISVASQAITANPTINLTQPIGIYNQFLSLTAPSGVSADDEYLQLDIALVAGVLQFKYDVINLDLTSESPFEITKPTRRIFFEDPFTQGTANFITNGVKNDLAFAPRPNINNKDIEVISDIVRNWAGITTDPNNIAYVQPNPTLFKNDGIAFAATGTSFANFNSDMASLFPKENFAYTYRQYGLGSDNSIIDLGSQVGLFEQDITNGTFIYNRQNNSLVSREASGVNVFDHFVNYTNALSEWLVSRYGLDRINDNINANDTYRVISAGNVDGYVVRTLIQRAGAAGTLLNRISTLLVRLWIGDSLLPADQTFINEVLAKFATQLPNAAAQITNRAKPPATGDLDTSTNAYRTSRQYIYYILQPYVISVLNRIIATEVTNFEVKRISALNTNLEAAFNQTSGNVQLPTDLIADVNSADANLANLSLVYLNRFGVEPAKDGKAAFKSLLNFINASGLKTRYLQGTDLSAFESFASTNFSLLDQTDLFTSATRRQELANLVNIMGVVTDKIYQNKPSQGDSLGAIVKRFTEGRETNPAALTSSLVKAFNDTVRTIGEGGDFEAYNFYGYDLKTSFLDLMIAGNNLDVIVREYIRRNDTNGLPSANGLSSDEIAVLKQFAAEQKSFNLGALFNFAVSQDRFVFKTFINSLSRPKETVEATASELLNKNLASAVQFEVDSNNQVFQNIANVTNSANYLVLAIGAVITAVGLLVTLTSLRRTLRKISSNRAIIERTVFIILTLAGIALIIISVIPGIL